MSNRMATPIENGYLILKRDGYSEPTINRFLKTLNQPTSGYIFIDELSGIADFAEPPKYKLIEGFNHYLGYSLYSVVGIDNDYVGEWTRYLSKATDEFNNLIGDK